MGPLNSADGSAENNHGTWLADYIRSVWGAFSFMYASHHGKLFIFILGICSSLPHTLPGKGSEQPPFNYVVSSACAHPCPDAASDIGKITGFLELSLKKNK